MIYQVIFIDPHDKIYANIYLDIDYTTKVIDIKLKFENIINNSFINWYNFYYKINNKLLSDPDDLIFSYFTYTSLINRYVYINLEKRKNNLIHLINDIKLIYKNDDIKLIYKNDIYFEFFLNLILKKAQNKQLLNIDILFDIGFFFGGIFSLTAEKYNIITYANDEVKLNYKIYFKYKNINPNSITIKYLNYYNKI